MNKICVECGKEEIENEPKFFFHSGFGWTCSIECLNKRQDIQRELIRKSVWDRVEKENQKCGF